MFRHVVKRLCEAIVVVSIGVGAFAPCAASPASVIQRDSLNPATYHSPSKTYVLQVDPSNPDGSGTGTYTVVRDGKQVWKGERDFALWHAAISDSGIVVGCAYTQGLGAFGNSVDGSNHLLAVVMDAAGQVVMRDARPRSYAGVDSNPPSPDAPTCMGIVLDEPNDLFLVRLKGAWRVREEKWATYSIKDAKLIREFVPEQPVSGERAFHRSHLCEIVPGTPLILMQWYTWKMTSDTPPFIVTHGARVSLLTSEGKEVWNFDIPGEYDGLGERWSDYWDLQLPGIVQTRVSTKAFLFHSYKLKSRVVFEVTADASEPSGWKVVETKQEPADAPKPQEAETKTQTIERKPLGAIRLQGKQNADDPSPLFKLFAFDMNEQAVMGVIRLDDDRRLMLVDSEGTVIFERSLAQLGKDVTDIAALAQGKWLVYDDGIGDGTTAAWIIDPSEAGAQFTKCDGLKVGALRYVAGLPDGGFVAFTGGQWAFARTLTAFDSLGNARWEKEIDCSPQDIAVTTSGRIAVLNGIVNTIILVTADGKQLGTIDLAASLGSKPNYVAGLSAGPNDGFVLHDFQGRPAVYVLDKDGKPQRSFVPAYEDGREFRLCDTARWSLKDACVWAAASDGVLRMADAGVADRTFGAASVKGDRVLRSVNTLCIGEHGDIYVVNEENGAVHVFQRDGTAVRVMQPDPKDFVLQPGSGSITAFGDGSVYYYPSTRFDTRTSFVHLSPDGLRIAKVRSILDEVRESWLAIPGSRSKWVVGYSTLALVNEKDEIVKRIERRPDNSWLGTLDEAAVAPDGSIAVICRSQERASRGSAVICVYSASGEPKSVISTPLNLHYSRLAFNGVHIAVTQGDALAIIPVGEGETKQFPLNTPAGHEAWWYLNRNPEGTEIWAHRTGTTEIVRYAFE